jgi:hypothetical protein
MITGKAADEECERMRDALARIEERARAALADWLAGGLSGVYGVLQAILDLVEAARGGWAGDLVGLPPSRLPVRPPLRLLAPLPREHAAAAAAAPQRGLRDCPPALAGWAPDAAHVSSRCWRRSSKRRW